MKHTQRGFTLVELLIVIVVLITLSSIAIVGWESVAAWSRDRAREQDTQQWASTFDLYKSRFVVYPIMPATNDTPELRCLGAPASFPTGRCGQFNSSAHGIAASDSSGLEAEATKVGKMPINSNEQLRGIFNGPILRIVKSTSGTTTTVDAWFINFFENACPKNFVTDTAVNNLAQGHAIGTTLHVCMIKKQFQFTAAS